MNTTQPYDAIVVGGGLAGLTCALALSGDHVSVPLRTLIIDAGPAFDKRDLSRDPRGSAITAGSRILLDILGVWEELEHLAQPFNQIIVTDSQGGPDKRPALLNFLANADGNTASAWMLENSILLAALIKKVRQTRRIEVRTDTTVEALRLEGSPATVTVTGGEQYSAGLVIAADGKSSFVRQHAGIEVVGWDYGQSGITMTVEHTKPHEGRAEEHFRSTGPFAILPLTGNRSSIVWSEKTQVAKDLMALPVDEFMDEFAKRFGTHLGEVKLVSSYASWPLSLQVAKSFAGSRLALIGDAAHLIHPIAGLGFNLALRDIAALTECVVEQLRLGLDHGGPQTLNNYESWRRADTIIVAAACDGLNRLFSNDNIATTAIRQAGLKMVDQIPVLKSFFVAQAAGVAGRQPKLMIGETV